MGGQPVTVGTIDQLAKGTEGPSRSLGDFFDHPVHPALEFAGRDDLVDHSPVFCFAGIQGASQQHQLRRPTSAQLVGQGPAAAAIRNRANTVVGDQKFRVFLGDHQIGHQRETEPCAGGDAPDRSDNRCVHAAK